MRVLHIITGLAVGGAELQVRLLMKNTRHQADVLCLYNPSTVAEMIEQDGGTVRNLEMRSNTQIWAVWRLRQIIRRGGYDVVHVHLYRACLYGRFAAWLARTPVIVTSEHSIGETHIERRKMTLGVRALYLATDVFSDATIAISDAVRDRLVKWGVPRRKLVEIPNGLDFGGLGYDPDARTLSRKQFGIDQDAYVLGVMGRLDPGKRIDLAIEAAAPLLGDGCKFLVVGTGDDRDRLVAAAERCGVADHVIFAGYQPDSAAMLSTMDLYVSTSAQEAFGLSILEALANGMPALFTACPALDGITTDRALKVSGNVDELRAEIAREVAAGHRPRLSVPEVAEQYGIESVAAQVDALYDRLRHGRHRQAHVNDVPMVVSTHEPVDQRAS